MNQAGHPKPRLISPEERRNLKTGMAKLYGPISDTTFNGLLCEVDKAARKR